MGAGEPKVVGSTFSKKIVSSIVSIENNGHYGKLWPPEIMKKFEAQLSYRLGTPANHQSWSKL